MNPTSIGLLHCNESVWAEYLRKLFLRDQNVRIEILNLDELVPGNPPEVTEVMNKSAITVLLMTPNMCEFLPGKTWLDDLFQKIPEYHTIFSVIAFVENSEIEMIKTNFPSSSKWQTTTLSQHTSDNVKMIADIIDIVEKSEKMKQCQVKEIIPSRIHSPGEKVAVLFKTSVSGTVQVSFDGGKNRIDTKKINPAAYCFRIPEMMPKSTKVDIYLDSVLISSKSIYFIRYGHEVFESIAFLKQCLGVETNRELDLKLCNIFEKSDPSDGSLSTLFSHTSHSSGFSNQSGLYPTILHLSAAHNLEEFTSLLLDARGALRAFEIKNKYGQNPADLAEANQHEDLARYIREFTDTESAAESCEIYVQMSNIAASPSYVAMATNTSNEENPEEIYSDPTPCLRTQKLESIEERSLPPTEIPRKGSLPPVPSKAWEQLGSGDLVRPGLSRSTSAVTPQRKPSASQGRHKSDPQLPSVFNLANAQSFLDEPRKLDEVAMGSSSLQELLDLMKLVKNKEYTQDDAEQSLKCWRGRPTSKSYKDRKRALAEISVKISSTKSSKQTLLDKLIRDKKSKRKDKEEWTLDISHPIVEEQSTPNISKNRASSTSNSSASTYESRDSCLSLSQEFLSDNEDEIQAEPSQNPTIQCRSSACNRSERLIKRVSRKDLFLEKSLKEEDEPPPPIPPRRKYSQNANMPISRPPPLALRKSTK